MIRHSRASSCFRQSCYVLPIFKYFIHTIYGSYIWKTATFSNRSLVRKTFYISIEGSLSTTRTQLPAYYPKILLLGSFLWPSVQRLDRNHLKNINLEVIFETLSNIFTSQLLSNCITKITHTKIKSNGNVHIAQM